MGQGQHHQDLRGRDAGNRAPRKNRVAHFAALVGLVLAPGLAGAPPPTAKFDKARAWAHLVKQVEFGPRYPGSKGHARCMEYLLAELGRHCDKVYKQEFSHTWSETGKPVRMANVVGEMNWVKAKTRVLLIAHWDTRPHASEEPDSTRARQPILGANDGASGVAVLLELARVLKEAKPNVGVMFLLTDGEDLGPSLEEMFLGARHFAKNLPSPRPDYGILLDMVGDKDLRIPIEPNSYAAAPGLVRAFYAHARQIGLGATFPNTFQTPIADDHLPLIEAGIPTMDLIDFDYEPWHTLRDTPDQCSAESLEKVGRAMELWLAKATPWRLSSHRFRGSQGTLGQDVGTCPSGPTWDAR